MGCRVMDWILAEIDEINEVLKRGCDIRCVGTQILLDVRAQLIEKIESEDDMVLHWHPICERCWTQITKFLDIQNYIWQCHNPKCKNSKGKHDLHEIVWEKESEGDNDKT